MSGTRTNDRSSSNNHGLDNAVLLEMFKKVMLIYICDERLKRAILSGKIIATFYSPRGQEIVSAAVAANLRTSDYLITTYRGLHDQLAKGLPLKELWAEFAGRVGGSCKGKGGPMHVTHPDSGVMVTTGIVGSGIPIANGLAWASQLDGTDQVTVTNFGDGASNIGAFHEGLNLAGVWKLPVIFICQNNRYAEHTKYENGTAARNVADRAQSYNMPGEKVDGNDPVAMWTAMRDAVARARSGGGPTLIEAVTFRFSGHNFGDPGTYIPAEEMAEALARDPVPAFRARLISEGAATEAELVAIEEAIGKEVDEAAAFAFASPYPSTDELSRDVYDEEITL
jgi:acetoin:2,6-dichlorophenolindophenol oxidoreductase subunit alpha